MAPNPLGQGKPLGQDGAVLVIDVQRGLFRKPTPIYRAEDLLANIAVLVDHARASDALAISRRIVFLVMGLCMLTGCIYIEPGARPFRVENQTAFIITVGPRVSGDPPERLAPGEVTSFTPQPKDCASNPWVATTDSGQIVAEILGACDDHRWTIRGLNDSTYN